MSSMVSMFKPRALEALADGRRKAGGMSNGREKCDFSSEASMSASRPPAAVALVNAAGGSGASGADWNSVAFLLSDFEEAYRAYAHEMAQMFGVADRVTTPCFVRVTRGGDDTLSACSGRSDAGQGDAGQGDTGRSDAGLRIFRLRSIFRLARASTRLPSIRPAMRETLLLRWTFCMRFAVDRGFAFQAASPLAAGHCCRAWRTSPAWAPPAAACRRRPTSSSMPCVQVATRRSSR